MSQLPDDPFSRIEYYVVRTLGLILLLIIAYKIIRGELGG